MADSIEDNQNRRLNWRQACEILGCGKTRFYAMVRAGLLPAYKVQGGRRCLWVFEVDCLRLVRRIDASCPEHGQHHERKAQKRPD